MTNEEKQQLNELIEWKRKVESEGVFNMDIKTEDIIRDRGFIIYTDRSSSTVTADKSLGIVINGVKYRINAL